MADRSNFIIMQLFHEMKQRFPAIPDRVVNECIRQNFNDKQICEAVLTVKNRNYSRSHPSPHMSKMLPASLNEGVSVVGAIEASATESETESSRCDDDTCNCSDTSATCETEDSESRKVVRKSAKGVRVAASAASAPAPQWTSTSSNTEESDTQWNKFRENCCEAFQVPSNFGPQFSQEGCGRGIGGGCCCRHAEDVDLMRQVDDGVGIANTGERVPIRHSGTGASVLPPADNDTVIDGLGDSDFFHDNLGGVAKNAPVTKYPPRSGGPPLASVSVSEVRSPPSSHMPNLADLSTQTSNLNLSASGLGTEFKCFNQLPDERTSREMDDSGFDPTRSRISPLDPLDGFSKNPFFYDPNFRFKEQGFMDESPVMPHDVEHSLWNVYCTPGTAGGSSNFLDGEHERWCNICGKGQTSTSSTVKVCASSSVSSPLNRKRANPSGPQPTPVSAGQNRFQGMKNSPPSMGRPITPTNYSNASASPTSTQLVETPMSFTTVSLRVRQPSSDSITPIDIRSSIGDSSLKYTSSSSYYPQQSFQSELEIRIGGGAGISSGSGCGSTTSSWKSQPPPPPSGKNLSSNHTPASQMRPPNQSSKLQVPTNRSGEKQHHSPLPTRREQPERPRSLYRPPSPGNVGKTPQASGSLPDVSKARSFGGEHDRNSGISARQSGVHHQPDPRVRPNHSVPSSPASGLPPPGPSSTGHSPKDRSRVPGTAPSPSSIEHRTTCPDVSRCKALLMDQIERKNLLERELNREREKLKTMQEEAQMMGKDLQQRQMRQRSHATLPIIQRVHTLRQEIQILQEECKKMTNEVDLHSDIQVPLGETDEEFYKNIYTGQRGWVLLPPLNAQSYASQRTENLHQHSRERRRDNPLPPRMDVPGDMGGRMRGGAGEGIGLGPGGEGPNWTCSMCTFRNHPALDKCEQCEMPRIMLEGSQTQDIHIHVTHHNFPMRSDFRYTSLPTDYT